MKIHASLDPAKRLTEAGADMNIRLERERLATALQAARSAVTEEDIERFKTLCSTDDRVAEEVDEQAEDRRFQSNSAKYNYLLYYIAIIEERHEYLL
ncbi:hypothetical protein An07g05200 [Aspergillus niger]|uniref:Uncharacterized protein n=2 Tax=Aspergillus niger TaxID=5061 RepID=A2QND0_ASPNC|nr:hypothetical protein An07g05200 [Aspergillus niger]CAK39439.1 hypothetical protein An07g05200 [Aspergillus niger]